MEEEEEEVAVVSKLRRQLEDENLSLELKLGLLNSALNEALNSAAVQTNDSTLAHVKCQLYHSGVLSHCVGTLSLPPTMLRGNWSSAATLAQLTSSCCVGVEPHRNSEAFYQLFLPSVVDGILSLADRLMRRTECVPLLMKVMDSLGWLLSAHPQLTSQVLSSVPYGQIQMCDDAAVSLLCVQMWTQTCSANRNFLSALSSDSVLLLLNEAVGQLAISADPAVGGASVKLILLMSSQLEHRLLPLLLTFRGLDSLLDKDWRGRGFEQDVDQLIALIQSEKDAASHSEPSSAELERAACVIQAAWRSHQTRRRVKSLSRAVSSLQRRYRARRRRQRQQEEQQQWEEELRYQVCVRRQQARRQFHQKHRELLQRLPADQVQPYLQECERRAAVLIQSFWRGCRERRRYDDAQRRTLRLAQTQQQAAHTLQRAVRRFLQKRRAAKAPPLPGFWIGQEGLTDGRRVELKRQVEEYVAAHPSTRVSTEECVRLHEEVQLLLLKELQRGEEHRREEQRRAALLAHTHTQLEKLTDAPPLSVVTVTEADSFLSPSGHVAARARDAHNRVMQASRLPWWRMLGETDPEGEIFGSDPLEMLEAELGGLYVGGGAWTD
ncbi:IQ calmodulin-binding motif-containing protein 1 [Salarias fasciatus]|uniref:IQ calmodulin-binding motif-containing protein 1 n=1 Tax=Salarias fasciatus TaxID=181472 RepID=UPI0011765A3F|nr:IQ calmodulin-binding motif-containing protein 1 [Salarias fasciatus]